MKNKESSLFSPVLPIVTALVLIGLPGCAAITGREAPTPEQLVPVEEQPSPAESPPEAQPPGEGPPVEVQITLTADRTNLQPGECATL